MSEVYLRLYDRMVELAGFVPGDEFIMPDDRVIGDIFLDSLDAIELIMWLEEEFDTEIDDTNLNTDYSLYEIADYIETYTAVEVIWKE